MNFVLHFTHKQYHLFSVNNSLSVNHTRISKAINWNWRVIFQPAATCWDYVMSPHLSDLSQVVKHHVAETLLVLRNWKTREWRQILTVGATLPHSYNAVKHSSCMLFTSYAVTSSTMHCVCWNFLQCMQLHRLWSTFKTPMQCAEVFKY